MKAKIEKLKQVLFNQLDACKAMEHRASALARSIKEIRSAIADGQAELRALEAEQAAADKAAEDRLLQVEAALQ